MRPARFVKICGITRVEDAVFAVEEGATAIGVNLVPGSKRFIDEDTARRVIDGVAGRTMIVAVVADRPVGELALLRRRLGIDWLQLHGEESPDDVAALQPHAIKAAQIATAADAHAAEAFSGEYLLVDSKPEGGLGGAGLAFDWSLVRALARTRRMILAGGLNPDNVAGAIAAVNPFGVDVASGVETSPGKKDPAKVRAFIEAVRRTGAP